MIRLAALLLVVVGIGTSPSAHAVEQVPDLEHAVVIVFENKNELQVIGARSAPTFNTMARRYAQLTNYNAVSHPSLPNYLALVSGSTHGIQTDCTACAIAAPNLADSLDAAGLTWKAYAEGLPRPGWSGPYAGLYAKKHVPFLYFRAVLASSARRAHVVPLTKLTMDLSAGALPDFAFVVPNLCHSMHECSVRVGDQWLAKILPPLLKLPNTAVFVTFDEGAAGSNHVPALVLGSAVRPGTQVGARTGHYSLLRTIEQAWGLPLLGHSAAARPITGIWR